MISHTPNLYQFSNGSENIRIAHIITPRIGTNGYNGALKGLLASGLVLRIIKTAVQTIMNAKRVPIFTSSARILSGRNPARTATKIPVMIVDFQGVLNFS